MLIKPDVFASRTLVAIGVDEWSVDGEYRCFALIPYEEVEPYVEVDVIAVEVKPKLIAPPMADWGPITKPDHEPNEHGYPQTKQVAEDLYWVWDDGAGRHPERAERLYHYFKPRIEYFRKAALEYHLLRHEAYKKAVNPLGYDTQSLRPPDAYQFYIAGM